MDIQRVIKKGPAWLIYQAKALIARIHLRRNRFCCLCDRFVGGFLPYRGGWRRAPKLMQVLDVIGSDLDNFSCPRCGSHDRERHLFLFLKKLDLLSRFSGARILHFAPESKLSAIIEDQCPGTYIKADLWPTKSGIVKMDMLDIPYSELTFDFVIANHVLEHIPADREALAEIYRVLKVGGMAILQTPYSGKLHSTFEDIGLSDRDSRLQAYGQEDHVRLYGKDIFTRLSSTGLKARISHHDEIMPEINSKKYGVNKKEPLFLYVRMI